MLLLLLLIVDVGTEGVCEMEKYEALLYVCEPCVSSMPSRVFLVFKSRVRYQTGAREREV